MLLLVQNKYIYTVVLFNHPINYLKVKKGFKAKNN